ncbi:MAG: response regulator [Sphingomonadaceae bacterium]|nr:response regulator [Sphingomonadaceae bacterium]
MTHCLIVDDSKVIRKVARHIMEGLGLSVDEAEDGAEALKACKSGPVDLVLLDWNMPVMSGMEFLTALNETEVPQRPKVMFCTTENGTAHIRAAIDNGADEYVMKPFDRDTLERKLQLIGLV